MKGKIGRFEEVKLKSIFVYIFLFAFAFLLRIYFLFATDEVLNADESLIMLMSKHIAELRNFPIFHYGNSYLGTLDNYLSVIFVKIFGLNVFSLRMTSVFLSLILILTTIKLVKTILGETEGFIAGLYIAVPPIFLLMWNVRFFIGYLDILILGNFLYYILLRFLTDFNKLQEKEKLRYLLLIGFISGLGIWSHFLFGLYIIISFVFIIVLSFYKNGILKKIVNLKNIFAYLFMFFVGILPVIIFNLTYQNKSSLSFLKAQAKMYSDFIDSLIIGLYNFIYSNGLSIFGFSPPWQTFRPQLTVKLHRPVIVIFESLLVLLLLIFFYIALKAKVNKNKFIKTILILLFLFSVVTIILMIYGYDWTNIIYSQRLFLEKLSLPFMLYEMENPKVLLYFLYIVPLIFIFFKEKNKIKEIFKAPFVSIKRMGFLLLTIHLFVLFLLYFPSARSLNRSPRFLFPIYTFLPFFVALIYKGLKKYSDKIAVLFVSAIIILNMGVDFSVKKIDIYKPIPYVYIKKMPDSYRPIITFLLKKKIYNIYSFYWVGFPIIFNSKEKIYSVDKSSRIKEYLERVNNSNKVAFVFWHTIGHYKEFEAYLIKNKINFTRKNIKGFLCYYDISVEKLRKLRVWKDILFVISLP